MTSVDVPNYMKDAVERADVYVRFNLELKGIEFISRNAKAPLTDKEKQWIVNYFAIRMIPLKVIFRN